MAIDKVFPRFCAAMALSVACMGVLRVGHAQQAPLTLEAAFDEALATSPSLHRWRADTRAQQWRVNRMSTAFLPRLGLEAGHQFAFKFAAEATGTSPTDGVVELKSPLTDIGGIIRLSLFDGMQDIRRLRASNLQLTAAQNEEQWAAFVLLRQVRFAFRRTLAAQDIELAARQDVATLTSHKQQVASMRAQGAATDFDVLRIDVSFANAKTAVLHAEDETYLARRKLAELMGMPDDHRSLVGALPRPETSLTGRIKALDSAQLPTRFDLAALEHSAHAQEALRAAAAGFWLPKLDAQASGSLYNNWDRSITNTSLFAPSWSLGVRLRWDIFDGGAALAEAGEHRASRESLVHRLHEAQLAQGYALEEGKRDYLYAKALFETRVLNIERAEQNLAIAMAGLRNGNRDSTDVLDAEQDLFASRAGVIEALLAIEKSCVHLELALGGAL